MPFTPILSEKTHQKVVKNQKKHPKMHKMKNQKPLSEYQKQRLGAAIEALKNPIFSTLDNQGFTSFS
jgi:hypothetical protein